MHKSKWKESKLPKFARNMYMKLNYGKVNYISLKKVQLRKLNQTFHEVNTLVWKRNNKALGRPTKVDASGYHTIEISCEVIFASYCFPSPLLCNVKTTYLPLSTLIYLDSNPFSTSPTTMPKCWVKYALSNSTLNCQPWKVACEMQTQYV